MKVKIFFNLFLFSSFLLFFPFLTVANSLAISPFYNKRTNSFDQDSFILRYQLVRCVKQKEELFPDTAMTFWLRRNETKIDAQKSVQVEFLKVIALIKLKVTLRGKEVQTKTMESVVQKDKLSSEFASWLSYIGQEIALDDCRKSDEVQEDQILRLFFESYAKIWSNQEITVKDILVFKSRINFNTHPILFPNYADLVIHVANQLNNEEEKRTLLQSLKTEIQGVLRKTGDSSALLSRLTEIYLILEEKKDFAEQIANKTVELRKGSPLDYLLLSIARGVKSGGGKEALFTSSDLRPNFYESVTQLKRYQYLTNFFDDSSGEMYVEDDEIQIPVYVDEDEEN